MGDNMIEKIACSILAGLFVLTVPVRAQDASPTDEIVVKAVNAEMFQITANIKLTQDQVNAVRSIVTDNIVKARDLQLSLENGSIDGKTMYDQRQQLINDENQALGRIFTPDQMKVWLNMPYQ